MDMKIVGSRIMAARKRKNITQRELAEALDVTVQAVSQWENDKTDASVRLPKLAAYFDCAPEFLTGESDSFGEKAPTVPSASEYDVPLMSLSDLPSLFMFPPRANTENPVIVRSSRKPEGRGFAVLADQDGAAWSKDDILIFDNGVKAEAGDVAAVAILSKRYAQIINSPNESHSGDLVGSLAHLSAAKDGSGDGGFDFQIGQGKVTPEGGASRVLIVGTMIERRTFRKRRDPD